MKKSLGIALLAAISSAHVFAQDIAATDVPSIVVNALQTKFSNVSDLEWEVEGELYKADFEIGTRDHKVWIGKTGIVTKHKADISKNDLPAIVKQHIDKDFKAYKIDDADKIESDGNIFYEVELDGSADDRKLLFTSDGKLLKNQPD